MNTIINLFSSSWAQALGWTLLHSIWQSLVIGVIVFVMLRITPSRFSSQRYAIATAGLLLTLIASISTFLYLSSTTPVKPYYQEVLLQHTVSDHASTVETQSVASVVELVRGWVQSNIPLIVILWGVGAFLFSLRVVGGWWYIRKLRNHALSVEGELSKNLQSLASKLNIRRFVALAESSIIQAPVVIGYLKPMILMPVGMCAGLSVEQLESILIHELVHIRRGDYLMNLVQSFLEAIFFFNPFVWIISGIMRREREHCCDDVVVSVHGNALAYARALTTLEEVRLSRSGLALSLAENKNQLLNRIKRIMEKSVQHYSGRERMVPVILLIIGLICASWLTIQSDNRAILKGSERYDEQLATADTTIKDKTSTYYKRQTTTTNEDGEPEVEVIEEINGDFDQADFSMHFNIDIPDAPPVPDFEAKFDFPMPPSADFAAIPDMLEIPEFDMMMHHMDTFPHGSNPHEWEEFSKAFEENFKSQFGDFYEKHEKELNKMMKNIEAQVSENVHQDVNNEFIAEMESLAKQQEKLARIQMKELSNDKDFVKSQKILAMKAEEMAKQFEETNAVQLAKMEKSMKKMEEKMKAMEKRHKEMEKAMEEELVKDGYLGKNEKLNNIDITNERIEINGKTIKSSDEKKYRKIIKEFQDPGEFTEFDGRRE